MSQKIYLYPKTSCPCEEEIKCVRPTGPESNMSVRGCRFPACLDQNPRVFLGTKNVVCDKKGWSELNPQVYSSKFDPSFGKIPCVQKEDGVGGKSLGCNDPSYLSTDPRLYSVTENVYLPLDRPPINGNVKLKDVYSREWDNYGAGYMPYKEVRDGQIEYYIDRSIENAYFSPNYAAPAQEVAVLFQDPMGALKPEYTRISKMDTGNPVTTCKDSYPCLSFIADTGSFREDILSYQMRKRLQSEWAPRWSLGD